MAEETKDVGETVAYVATRDRELHVFPRIFRMEETNLHYVLATKEADFTCAAVVVVETKVLEDAEIV